jgi:DNA repair photolyase
MNLAAPDPVGMWSKPAVIARNNFQYKSLSDWSFNTAVGCAHGCRFCYVPSVSTIKQATRLGEYGIADPDADWGAYVLLRPWDEAAFLGSLRAADKTPLRELSADGNRAVMFSTTTDPYQVIPHPDASRARELTIAGQRMVRRALELIRDHSTINVRILTRSPLARADFDLYQSFGHRLLFGMSIPTLRNDLSKVYEPRAPAPTQRLATLRAARAAGIHVYVAMAPTYPECDEADIRATISAIADLDPVTIFHEPINIRAENVERIRAHDETLGVELHTAVFDTRDSWRAYALNSLNMVVRVARELGVIDRLHLWPDKALGAKEAVAARTDAIRYQRWLRRWWTKVSAWPVPAADSAAAG